MTGVDPAEAALRRWLASEHPGVDADQAVAEARAVVEGARSGPAMAAILSWSMSGSAVPVPVIFEAIELLGPDVAVAIGEAAQAASEAWRRG